jgi:hypothetical protein
MSDRRSRTKAALGRRDLELMRERETARAGVRSPG